MSSTLNSFCTLWYIYLNIYINRRLHSSLPCLLSLLLWKKCNHCQTVDPSSMYIYSEYYIFINHMVVCFIFLMLGVYLFSLSSCIIFNGFCVLAEPLQIPDMINGNRFPIIQMLFYPPSLIAAFLTLPIVHSWWPVSPQSFPQLKWGLDLYVGELKTHLFQYQRETAVFWFWLEFPRR